MSHVADIILIMCNGERGVAHAQQWLADHDWPPLTEISPGAGGNRAMQCEIWSAGINYFDCAAFAAALSAIPWEWPECVHLLVKDEHDERFFLRSGSPLGGPAD